MTDTPSSLPTANDYEDIEIVKGSGFKYRFFLRFPGMKMLQFNRELSNLAKKEIYNAMLENGEIGNNPVGYQMVSSKLAMTWVLRDGFESPEILEFLCNQIVKPLDEKAPPVLDALLEADEASEGAWQSEEITQDTPKNLSGLLQFILERDLAGKAGLNLLKLFFIRLITKMPKTPKSITNSTEPLPEAGMAEKMF